MATSKKTVKNSASKDKAKATATRASAAPKKPAKPVKAAAKSPAKKAATVKPKIRCNQEASEQSPDQSGLKAQCCCQAGSEKAGESNGRHGKQQTEG